MKSIINKVKESVHLLKESGIYQMGCGNYDAIYIDQCERRLESKISEHFSYIRKFKNIDFENTPSSFANHTIYKKRTVLSPMINYYTLATRVPK